MVNSLKLGWVDYSSEHREKVMAVLHALAAPEAVDELGIGRIRDGFAEILFPGTSTIQTRAKYFFIVPYLLMDLEKEKHKSADELIKKLGEAEINLIEVLNQDAAEGVIGARAGRGLKRKPSNIYWNGLRTFGIFRHDNLSLNNYARAVLRLKKNKELISSYGNEEDEAVSSEGGTFWRCIQPDPNWKETLSINLTYEEASFLKSRILTTKKTKDSLMAFLLKEGYEKLQSATEIGEIGSLYQLPESIKEDFERAVRFNHFISGANIRYNVILSSGENALASDRWAEWVESSFVTNDFQDFNYREILSRLDIKSLRLIRFLDEWQQAVMSGSLDGIDQLIIKREIELKSKNRAKLNNPEVYRYKHDNWVGSYKLQYRFPGAKTIINDIFEGLGDSNA